MSKEIYVIILRRQRQLNGLGILLLYTCIGFDQWLVFFVYRQFSPLYIYICSSHAIRAGVRCRVGQSICCDLATLTIIKYLYIILHRLHRFFSSNVYRAKIKLPFQNKSFTYIERFIYSMRKKWIDLRHVPLCEIQGLNSKIAFLHFFFFCFCQKINKLKQTNKKENLQLQLLLNQPLQKRINPKTNFIRITLNRNKSAGRAALIVAFSASRLQRKLFLLKCYTIHYELC